MSAELYLSAYKLILPSHFKTTEQNKWKNEEKKYPPRRYSLFLGFLSRQKFSRMFCRCCVPFLSPVHPLHHCLQNGFGFCHSQLVKITDLFPVAKANGHFCPDLTQLLGSQYSTRQPLDPLFFATLLVFFLILFYLASKYRDFSKLSQQSLLSSRNTLPNSAVPTAMDF